MSGSSAFSKSDLYIWKFLVHVLLKPNLNDFEHYVTSMWNECNCAVVWALPFFGVGMKTNLFQSCGHCWVFQICWRTECSTFTASSFRIWNSSTGVPSPLLALFAVMLPKAHLTSHSRMSGSRCVITPLWLDISYDGDGWDLFSLENTYTCIRICLLCLIYSSSLILINWQSA